VQDHAQKRRVRRRNVGWKEERIVHGGEGYPRSTRRLKMERKLFFLLFFFSFGHNRYPRDDPEKDSSVQEKKNLRGERWSGKAGATVLSLGSGLSGPWPCTLLLRGLRGFPKSNKPSPRKRKTGKGPIAPPFSHGNGIRDCSCSLRDKRDVPNDEHTPCLYKRQC